MSLMKLLVPAALVLLIFAVYQAVTGFRRKSWGRIASALCILAVLAAGAWLLMKFLTRLY